MSDDRVNLTNAFPKEDLIPGVSARGTLVSLWQYDSEYDDPKRPGHKQVNIGLILDTKLRKGVTEDMVTDQTADDFRIVFASAAGLKKQLAEWFEAREFDLGDEIIELTYEGTTTLDSGFKPQRWKVDMPDRTGDDRPKPRGRVNFAQFLSGDDTPAADEGPVKPTPAPVTAQDVDDLLR